MKPRSNLIPTPAVESKADVTGAQARKHQRKMGSTASYTQYQRVRVGVSYSFEVVGVSRRAKLWRITGIEQERREMASSCEVEVRELGWRIQRRRCEVGNLQLLSLVSSICGDQR